MNVLPTQIPNPNVRRILQITEEVQKPVHVPFVINNECYVITQQDVRKIEDTRLLSYSKLLANGKLEPIDGNEHETNAQDVLQNAIFRCAMQQHQFQQQQQQSQAMNVQNTLATQHQPSQHVGFGGFDVSKTISSPLMAPRTIIQSETPMDTAPPTVATIHQQLRWAKCAESTSTAFPMTYTAGTSTTELSPHVRFEIGCAKKDQTCQCCRWSSCCCCKARSANNKKTTCNKGSTTEYPSSKSSMETLDNDVLHCTGIPSAQEQRKQRKTCSAVF